MDGEHFFLNLSEKRLYVGMLSSGSVEVVSVFIVAAVFSYGVIGVVC